MLWLVNIMVLLSGAEGFSGKRIYIFMVMILCALDGEYLKYFQRLTVLNFTPSKAPYFSWLRTGGTPHKSGDNCMLLCVY